MKDYFRGAFLVEREKKRKDDKILVIEESSVKSLTNRYKLCRIYERRAKKNMEAYRSGHNGHDWKSCSLNGLRGSNPLASAIKHPSDFRFGYNSGYNAPFDHYSDEDDIIEQQCKLFEKKS